MSSTTSTTRTIADVVTTDILLPTPWFKNAPTVVASVARVDDDGSMQYVMNCPPNHLNCGIDAFTVDVGSWANRWVKGASDGTFAMRWIESVPGSTPTNNSGLVISTSASTSTSIAGPYTLAGHAVYCSITHTSEVQACTETQVVPKGNTASPSYSTVTSTNDATSLPSGNKENFRLVRVEITAGLSKLRPVTGGAAKSQRSSKLSQLATAALLATVFGYLML